MRYVATVDGRDFEIDVERSAEIAVDGSLLRVDLQPIDGLHLYSLILDHHSYDLHVERREGIYYILIEGDRYAVDVEQERLKLLRVMGGEQQEDTSAANIVAPMPGLVVKVLVAPGDEVAADQGLLILEAMKMENEIRSPRAGIVRLLSVEDGARVNQGDMLVVVEEDTD